MTHLDTKTALALVNQGADPNTLQYLPVTPTLEQRMDCLLHHKSLSKCFTDDSGDSMFMLLCGTGMGGATNREASILPFGDNLPLLQAMYEHGAAINAKTGFGVAALHYAAAANRLRIAEWLLQHGADINVQDEAGRTPLMMTTANRHIDMTRLLLVQGANPNMQDMQGRTALDYASQKYDGSESMRALLTAHGATANPEHY